MAGDAVRNLDTDWGRLAFTDSGGGGPCFMFLHGTNCDSEDWRETLAYLPDSLRAVTLDFRGHGNTTTPEDPFTLANLANDVLDLLAALEVEKAYLVGHSLGGMAAMEAARKSDRAAGLVLLEGWTSLRANSAFGRGRFYGTLADEQIARITRKRLLTQERRHPWNWDRFWTSVMQFDATSFLEETAIPIYEVYGAMGRLPETPGRLLVPERPNIEWVWIPDSGHYLPHERPREVAEVVRSFMETYFA